MNQHYIFKFSETTSGLPIWGHRFEGGGAEILVLGGVHGDEPEGVVAAQKLLEICWKSFAYKLNLTLVPQFNLDGILKGTRGNARGVDLNRNLPTKDWSPEAKSERYFPGSKALSESENEGLVTFIETHPLEFILTLHSWFPVLNTNGDCNAAAAIIAARTGYRIDPEIGYPTPGSLGTYAGIEGRCPTLTYEIERDLDFASIQKIHAPAVYESLKIYQK